MTKAEGAFLTIGELAQQLGVAQHVLRYWETRFPQLRPLQRSGNRRYYRPQDVDVARRINRLLNVEGFTVKGAIKALSARRNHHEGEASATGSAPGASDTAMAAMPIETAAEAATILPDDERLIARLKEIRSALASAIGD